jgi:hypothetical protein
VWAGDDPSSSDEAELRRRAVPSGAWDRVDRESRPSCPVPTLASRLSPSVPSQSQCPVPVPVSRPGPGVPSRSRCPVPVPVSCPGPGVLSHRVLVCIRPVQKVAGPATFFERSRPVPVPASRPSPSVPSQSQRPVPVPASRPSPSVPSQSQRPVPVPASRPSPSVPSQSRSRPSPGVPSPVPVSRPGPVSRPARALGQLPLETGVPTHRPISFHVPRKFALSSRRDVPLSPSPSAGRTDIALVETHVDRLGRGANTPSYHPQFNARRPSF